MAKLVSDTKKNNELINTLKQWTGKSKYNTLLDSSEDEINNSIIVEKMKGKSGLMVICKYGDNIFGCYNSLTLEDNPEKMIISGDKKHFVFHSNLQTNKNNKYLKYDSNDRSLIVFAPKQSKTQNIPLIQCYGAFTIEVDTSSKRSQIDYSFEGNYDAKKETADLFIGQKFFVYDSLIILEWV